MRNCREITALVSQGLDKKLTLAERFSVWLHVSMCTNCRTFEKQVQFIHNNARHYVGHLKTQQDKKKG